MEKVLKVQNQTCPAFYTCSSLSCVKILKALHKENWKKTPCEIGFFTQIKGNILGMVKVLKVQNQSWIALYNTWHCV